MPSLTMVIVNGHVGLLTLVERLIDDYDSIIVLETVGAYTRINEIQPDLVLVCIEVDFVEGPQLLTMLRLDPKTSDIPVIVQVIPPAEQDEENEIIVDEIGVDDELAMTVIFTPPRSDLLN